MARDEIYRIAEQTIEAALRAGVKELDLMGGWIRELPTLTELPESLGQLSQLQSLNLARNRLTALPESRARRQNSCRCHAWRAERTPAGH